MLFNDPYIQKKFDEFDTLLERLTQYGQSVPTDEITIETVDEALQINAEEVPSTAVSLFKERMASIQDDSYSNEDIAQLEALLSVIPKYSWWKFLKEDVELLKKKLNIKSQIDALQQKLEGSESLSYDKVKVLIRQYKIISFDIDELPHEHRDNYRSKIEHMEQPISNLLTPYLEEGPIQQLEALAIKLVESVSVKEIIQYRREFKLLLSEAIEVATLSLHSEVNSKYRYRIQEAKKAYDSSALILLEHMNASDDDLFYSIIEELELNGVDRIEDKKEFREFLQKQTLPEPQNINEFKEILQNMISLYNLQKITNVDDFLEVYTIVGDSTFRRLHPEDQKFVAAQYFAEHKEKLPTYESIEQLKQDVSGYIENVTKIIETANTATAPTLLTPYLASLDEKWKSYPEDKQIDIAASILMKAAHTKYRSIATISRDIPKAYAGTLLEKKERKSKLQVVPSEATYVVSMANEENMSEDHVPIKIENSSRTFTTTLTVLVPE